MTTLADRTIQALRAEHNQLAAIVATLTDEALTGPSGASEWTVAQVLSHLGSGAEIALRSVHTALGVSPKPADDFNQGVWDHWNALPPRAQASGSVEQDAVLVAAFEALDDEQRESIRFELGFVPFPLPVSSVAGMRLNETAPHGWDVRVALDPAAGLSDDSARVLVEQLTGGLSMFLGFLGKAAAVSEPVVLDFAAAGLTLAIDDGISLAPPDAVVTATFAGPREAAVRLLTGRLSPQHTPAEVEVEGNLTLEVLREVFPGF